MEIGIWCRSILIVLILRDSQAEKQKRQIFREQVLPALGGKIPEDAFRTDRLALNRLNKEGISVPDGVLLDQRHVQKHPQHVQRMPDVIKVYLTSDGRYTPPEGRYHYKQPKAVDTTYVITKPFVVENRYISTNHQPDYKAPNRYGAFQETINYGNAYSMLHGHSDFKQFAPIIPPEKPGVYRPINVPLVLPNTHLIQPQFDPSWKIAYEWPETFYQPYEDYFINSIALFNPHQIITDYEGFLHKFHDRHHRHVQSRSSNNNQRISGPNYHDRKVNQTPLGSDYPNLTRIPETNFSCNGRKGLFADAKTKCQVFHDCTGWSKTSSLCPPGTAFSQIEKRCEWWNKVQCNKHY
ncbi:uncharacterized protein [Prorops nasuta]|uniref:uncharacterized protein n=1 Tax=Prorops nasuta TaxID=863751 RepID=UPI0034CE6EF5